MRLGKVLRRHLNKVYPSGRKLTVTSKGKGNVAKWVIGESMNNMKDARDDGED